MKLSQDQSNIPPCGVDLELAAPTGFGPGYRLRKTDEFSSVFAFRRSLRGGPFQLFFRPSGLATARLGVVVGKKFVRSAVARNRIKRVVREAFRLSRYKLPTVDVIFRVGAKPAPDSDLRAEVEALLRRLAGGSLV